MRQSIDRTKTMINLYTRKIKNSTCLTMPCNHVYVIHSSIKNLTQNCQEKILNQEFVIKVNKTLEVNKSATKQKRKWITDKNIS